MSNKVTSLSVAAAAFLQISSFSLPAWAAGSAAQPSGVKHFQVLKDGPGNGAATISRTTHWRKINGWERSLTDKNPGLSHWSWMGMQEMEKSYMHVAPGQVGQKGTNLPPREPRYVKPKHVPTTVRSSSHPPVMVSTSAPGGHYIKPKHVATTPPPPTDMSTYIRYYPPKTKVALSAPRTAVQLAAPKTDASLASKNTSIQLAAPRTNIQLAAPQTAIQLAAPRTSARLAVPEKAKPKPAAPPKPDVMAKEEAPPADGVDTFTNPDAYAHNPYGLARHVSSGGSSAAAAISGKVITHPNPVAYEYGSKHGSSGGSASAAGGHGRKKSRRGKAN